MTLIGSVRDFVLGVAKIAVGWLANSQALIVDGVHSFSGLLTDPMGLYAAKHVHKEADEITDGSRHPRQSVWDWFWSLSP